MAHGTPSSMAEMPEYLRLVRGGRPASPELVAEMTRNYEAIGGRSPLTDLTIAQGDALGRRLGDDVPVAIGMRNWIPFIKDAIAGLAARGVTRIIAIPLAQQLSTLSVSSIRCGRAGAASRHELRRGSFLSRTPVASGRVRRAPARREACRR
jgi:ferrochelatase